MATQGHNLSVIPQNLPAPAPSWRVAIVQAEWNAEITDNLASGANEALLAMGLDADQIVSEKVPGTYELPIGAQWCIELLDVDAVICVGCVIRGETSHFDYVCEAASSGIKDVGLKFNRPVIFGVLTDDNIQQSRARSGGALGNKGVEAAVSAIQLLHLRSKLQQG